MEIVHYNFDNFVRADAKGLDAKRRERFFEAVQDEVPEGMAQAIDPEDIRPVFFTRTPEDGGEINTADGVRVEFDDIFEPVEHHFGDDEWMYRDGGHTYEPIVFAADAFVANEVVRGRATPEDYFETMVRVEKPEDIPEFRHERTTYCHCGCGQPDAKTNFDYVEIIQIRVEPHIGWLADRAQPDFGYKPNFD